VARASRPHDAGWMDRRQAAFLMKSGDKMDTMIEFFLVLIEGFFRDNGGSD
jgi:hypothetical protein